MAGMEDGPLSRLDALRPAIKARWQALLQENPVTPRNAVGLVTPKMLMFMVDETLNRLASEILPTRLINRRPASLAPFGPMRHGCKCGLQLLLTYYLTGAKVLREILPAELGVDRVKVLRCFNRIAHDEMDTLCGVCLHRGGPMCSLRPGPASGNSGEFRRHGGLDS